MPNILPPGSKVDCRFRVIKSPSVSFQATSVIFGGRDPSFPSLENTARLDFELDKYLTKLHKVDPARDSLVYNPLKHPDFLESPLQGGRVTIV